MLAVYGKREWLLSGIILGLIALILLFISAVSGKQFLSVLALLSLFLWLPVAFFFRDPSRKIPCEEYVIVSPADGIIKDICSVPSPFDENIKFKRVGIFLSVFDVHINRMPVDVEVEKAVYSRGAFHDARSEKASKENESNTILCRAICGNIKFHIIVRQISGLIARKIVSTALPQKKFSKGEKFGMIKFGSRTELYIPDEEHFEICVKTGDRVYAGSTIIARIRNT